MILKIAFSDNDFRNSLTAAVGILLDSLPGNPEKRVVETQFLIDSCGISKLRYAIIRCAALQRALASSSRLTLLRFYVMNDVELMAEQTAESVTGAIRYLDSIVEVTKESKIPPALHSDNGESIYVDVSTKEIQIR